jgi:glycosyltransferase involved in cell wall biosynthesis
MRRLVLVTQQLDEEHPVLAATLPKLHALARRVDEVTVMTAGVVRADLPANCRVRRFRGGRVASFVSALSAELRPRPVGVLVHMTPVYATLAAPLARPLGVPVLLWFVHVRRRPRLWIGQRLATRVLTVDEASFPYPSPRVVPIGHGIDVARFGCGPPDEGGPLRLLSLGRYGAVKRLDLIAEGVRRACDGGADLRLAVHGAILTAAEREDRRRLEQTVARLELRNMVELADAVPQSAVPDLLARTHALVNATAAGSADKVVFEAAAACRPPLASSPAFARLLPDELRFSSAEELGHRLVALASRPRAELHALGRSLRARVEAEHSVDSWADAVLAQLAT